MKSMDKASYEMALQHCANEPIHQIGSIQPHGAVLVLSADFPRIVLQSSANLSAIIGISTEIANGSAIAQVLGEKAAIAIEQLILEAKEHQTVTANINLKQAERCLNLQIHVYQSQGMFVLELAHDDIEEQKHHLSPLFLKMQKRLLEFRAEKNITPYFNQLARLLRDLMAYDSVMVYRFDSNWNGEIIAQSSIDEAPSYLGLNFPASDIPAQARRLYAINSVRLIADINATPVPLVPTLNPNSLQALDMTHSVLRSLSPIHLEYLRNMGVNATMAISLMQNNKL